MLYVCKIKATHVSLKSSLGYLQTLVRGFQTFYGTTQFEKCLSFDYPQYSNDLFFISLDCYHSDN